MKKYGYIIFTFFALFLTINSVSAVNKVVYQCAYNIDKNKIVLQIIEDSESKKITTKWFDKSELGKSKIDFANINVDSKDSCPILYYHKMNFYGKINDSQNGYSAGTSKKLTPTSEPLTSDENKDYDDVLGKTNYLTCEYKGGLKLYVYDDKTIKIIDNGACGPTTQLSGKVDSTRDCPIIKEKETRDGGCMYNFGTGSVVPLANSSATDSYENENGAYKPTISGEKFKYLLEQLKTPLGQLSVASLSVKLTIGDNNNATLGGLTGGTTLCDGIGSKCSDSLDYFVEKGIKDVAIYCNDFYSDYHKYNGDATAKVRMNECIAFDAFYGELVKQNIVNNLGAECGVISKSFQEKLIWILDILKIAGPVIAIALGMFDFLKVIAAGEVDKEMKSAWKRFLYRIIAAACLFLIPVLLAWALEMFLGADLSDNPFCGVVEWSSK